MVVSTVTDHIPQNYLDRLLFLVKKYEHRSILTREESIELFNAWADYWRYYIGVNVIPCISKMKLPTEKWEMYQDKPIPEEVHNAWKNNGRFNDGMAIIMGKVWHRKDLGGYYISGIDADNLVAIKELLSRKGITVTPKEFAKNTIVEQHSNNPEKMHFYIYTIGLPLHDKTSDIGRLKGTVDLTTIPCFEVKASGDFLMYPSPGMHKSGQRYQILGTYTPKAINEDATIECQEHLDGICKKYGLIHNGNSGCGNGQIPIEELFKTEFKVYEGHNRHIAVLRVADSLLRRNNSILSLDRIKDLLYEWDNEHCVPPLQDKELEKQWRCALEYTIRQGQKDNPNGDNDTTQENNNSWNTNARKQQELNDYIDYLIEVYHLKTLDDTGEIWYYNDKRGIFVPGAEPIIKSRIELDFKADKLVTNKDVNEYIGRIQRRTYIKREAFNPDNSWIATKNCMVNLRTGQAQSFDPKFMNTTQIPVEYYLSPVVDFFDWVEDPVFGYGFNRCPKILKFLYDLMSCEDVELLLDFLAYCLWRDYKFNVWMLFNGAGQNGKSTLLNLIERFFGSENVSGESLERLLTKNFAPANLYQKMVNLDADLSGDILLRHTGKLKKLTGNDVYPAEIKYKTPFKFRNHAKLIFSCNTIPQIDDTTDAFFRRLIIINFTQQFFGSKEDINLIDKLTTDGELSGLFHILLSRLPRVLENGVRKTTNKVMESTYDKYMRGANPVGYFVERVLVVDAASKVRKVDMYEAYTNFCNENGLALESDQSFSRKMSKDFGFTCKQYREKGEKPYFWIRVRLKTHGEIDEQSRLEEVGEYSPATQEEMK